MDHAELLQIEPSELTFVTEKHGLCKLHLTNKTTNYVAFRLRLTNVEKYGVTPKEGGIIMPQGTFDITVTRKSEKSPPPGFECNDKFLIQAMALSVKGLFTENSGKRHVEEKELRAVLQLPPNIDFKPENPSGDNLENPSSDNLMFQIEN